MSNRVWLIIVIALSFARASTAADLHCGELKPISSPVVKREHLDSGEGLPSSLGVIFLPRTHKRVIPFAGSYREHGRIPDIERSEIQADTYYSHIESHLLSELRGSFSRQIPDVSLLDDAEYKINVKSAGTTIQLKNDVTVLSMHFSIIAYKTAPKDYIWRRMCTVSASGSLPEGEGLAYTTRLADGLTKEISNMINSNQEVLK